MNDYAEALKKQILKSMDITSEETAVFIDVAQRTAAISGINLSEFFEILAGFCRDIDSFFKVIQETAESLTEIFKQVKSLTIPPAPFTPAKVVVGAAAAGRAGGNADTDEIPCVSLSHETI